MNAFEDLQDVIELDMTEMEHVVGGDPGNTRCHRNVPATDCEMGYH